MQKNGHGMMMVLLLSALVLQGCAHSKTQEALDKKLTEEVTVSNPQELADEAQSLIATAPGLSESQREQLSGLRTTTSSRMGELQDKSLRLRSQLIKDTISKSYNAKEVSLIKKRLKEVESKRLSLIFDTVDKANRILGRQAAESGSLVSRLVETRGIKSN